MLSLGLAALSSLALAQEAPPIVNGERTSEFEQVGSLLAYNGQSGGVFCSATLIHAKWVATAAHCIAAMDSPDYRGMDFYFLIGDNAYSEDGILEFAPIVDWIAHPSYNSETLAHDIGVIELESALSWEPIPLSEEPVSRAWTGRTLDYVGWGATTDNGSGSGVKRHAEIGYYDYTDQVIYGYDTTSNLCSGDSGGASLYDRGDGAFELVGVNSFVFAVQSNTPCVGGGSGATRVDVNYGWIAEYVPLEENEPEEVIEGDDTGPSFSDTGDLPNRPLDGDADIKGGCSSAPAGSAGSAGLGLALFGLLALGRRRS